MERRASSGALRKELRELGKSHGSKDHRVEKNYSGADAMTLQALIQKMKDAM